jgi:GDP/UDP-N,N'-diacetylbacillosamine 2-epimerase (hydrolysing)
MKSILVVTGSRSDYDLLFPIIQEIKKSKRINLKLVVTGSHLKKTFGLTYKKIIKDNLRIDFKIPILGTKNNIFNVLNAISNIIKKIFIVLVRIKPDFVLILGDRYEIFGVAIAAANAKIPIIHVAGGEFSEASIDECYRNSITKFSNIHFVSSEIYLNKVKQLGENPKYIFNVGSTGVDNIINNNYISKTEIENLLDFKLCEKNFLITIHPLSSLSKEENIRNTINILKVLDKFKNTGLIFTYPNADFQNNFIINLVKNFIKGKKNCKLSITLGRELYLSCIKICDLVIGNSSSGIIEVPYFKKPTVNIGDRQLGRLRHKSIIDTNFDQRNILLSIKKGLSKNFCNRIKKQKLFFGNGDSSRKIVRIIEKLDLKFLKNKKFYELT